MTRGDSVSIGRVCASQLTSSFTDIYRECQQEQDKTTIKHSGELTVSFLMMNLLKFTNGNLSVQ